MRISDWSSDVCSSDLAIRAIGQGLPKSIETPNDIGARSSTLYGAWLAGATLGMVGMGLHHKICHTLGGTFDLPHADVHAIVLPYVAEFNASAAPGAMARVAMALRSEEHTSELQSLMRISYAVFCLKKKNN